MAFPSSLRAQRGNPDFGAAAGLPRRVVCPERLQGSRRAPRNDVLLCAFASSRESNLFLFSRKGAKALRGRVVSRPEINIIECAADVLRLLGHNMPPVGA